MSTLTYTGTLVIEDCYKCHVAFAFPREMYDRCKRDGDEFFCPSGHGQVYATTENAKLKSQLERAQRDATFERECKDRARKEADHQARRARSLKGVVTKTKQRVANGKCPCCHQEFPDLADHMGEQHPDYTS